MKVKLVFQDWRQKGKLNSIYETELGFRLSTGDLHSGTTFDAELNINPDIECELKAAAQEHAAYPVFAVMVKELGA